MLNSLRNSLVIRRSKRAINILSGILQSSMADPRLTAKAIETLPYTIRGLRFGRESKFSNGSQPTDKETMSLNPIAAYFESHKEGPGIWKWRHYFDIYHRHFSKFVGREVHVLEIGIYSGGSLLMWKDYFGPNARIYGVDISEACRVYEDDRTKVFIGDQADRSFWAQVRKAAPAIDIIIDDGGHLPEQQIVTLEETLPHLRPGGVYLCEDVTNHFNQFAAYIQGISDNLNYFNQSKGETPTPFTASSISTFQAWINAVHL